MSWSEVVAAAGDGLGCGGVPRVDEDGDVTVVVVTVVVVTVVVVVVVLVIVVVIVVVSSSIIFNLLKFFQKRSKNSFFWMPGSFLLRCAQIWTRNLLPIYRLRFLSGPKFRNVKNRDPAQLFRHILRLLEIHEIKNF